MRRLKCIVSYDGTDYSGFQTQPKEVTIQGEIETAVKRITGETLQIVSSGRTDAGVHARGMVFHMDTASTIPADKWRFVLNNQLPDAIIIQSVEEVSPTFHARYDAKLKEYRYCIDNSQIPDLLHHRYADHNRHPLNITAMQEAANYLIGQHDFTSYCSTKTFVENKVRTIHELRVVKDGNFIWVICRGNGFLYNMVRIIVGTLVQVGRGKRRPEAMREILEARDRKRAGKTAPAKGLTMWQVEY